MKIYFGRVRKCVPIVSVCVQQCVKTRESDWNSRHCAGQSSANFKRAESVSTRLWRWSTAAAAANWRIARAPLAARCWRTSNDQKFIPQGNFALRGIAPKKRRKWTWSSTAAPAERENFLTASNPYLGTGGRLGVAARLAFPPTPRRSANRMQINSTTHEFSPFLSSWFESALPPEAKFLHAH